MFTKEDLKSGMRCKLKNGDMAIVIGDVVIWNNGRNALRLSGDYDKEMKMGKYSINEF